MRSLLERYGIQNGSGKWLCQACEDDTLYPKSSFYKHLDICLRLSNGSQLASCATPAAAARERAGLGIKPPLQLYAALTEVLK
jgi:hypothetical protein